MPLDVSVDKCSATENEPAANGHSETSQAALKVILSFDVEEHHLIEAAVGLSISPKRMSHYRQRLEVTSRWILEQLDQRNIKATFFIVGEVAVDNPSLVRDIHRAGHEIASHGWNHRRVHHFTPATFRKDVLNSKDALEELIGEAVVGYRAPTFSIVRQTAWALDVLAEAGMEYDSSIFPVWHDRYGVPGAPRFPFKARGKAHEVLELPPAILRVLGNNLPAGGGGYFRLFPLLLLRRAINQISKGMPPVAMLYFHPWEFDTEQDRLPLGWLNRIRTYTGLSRSRKRLVTLLAEHTFVRAVDVARSLRQNKDTMPSYTMSP